MCRATTSQEAAKLLSPPFHTYLVHLHTLLIPIIAKTDDHHTIFFLQCGKARRCCRSILVYTPDDFSCYRGGLGCYMCGHNQASSTIQIARRRPTKKRDYCLSCSHSKRTSRSLDTRASSTDGYTGDLSFAHLSKARPNILVAKGGVQQLPGHIYDYAYELASSYK